MRSRPFWLSALILVLGLVAAIVWVVLPKRTGSPSPGGAAEASELAAGARPLAPRGSAATPWLGLPATSPAAARPSAEPPSAAAMPEHDGAAEATLERDRQIELLRGSGPPPSGFLHAAEKVSHGWEELARATSGEIDVKTWECHRAGCFLTAVHRSARSVEDMSSRILGSAELASWTGPKSRSAPVPLPDGRIELTWLLFAAESDGGS